MQIPTNIYGLELLRWVCQTPELTNEDIVIRDCDIMGVAVKIIKDL